MGIYDILALGAMFFILVEPIDKLLAVEFLRKTLEHKKALKTLITALIVSAIAGTVIIASGYTIVVRALENSIRVIRLIGGIVLIVLSLYVLKDLLKENGSSVSFDVSKLVNPYAFAVFPLTFPLTLGPVLLVTAITKSIDYGVGNVICGFLIGLTANYGLMVYALKKLDEISREKVRVAMIGVALFVLAVGVQMLYSAL